MIKKIISGSQTGADRAALDVAIRLGIPHGGWVPKGRLAEDGVISDKYHLKEMPTPSYPLRTEQNVIDSDGTLILSHGNLTGGSEYTKEYADKHKRPCLHINLNEIPVNEASPLIAGWIFKYDIEVLNVAGSRASKDPKIYEKTFHVIDYAYWLCQIKSDATNIKLTQPKTVDETVDQIVAELPLNERVAVANFSEDQLVPLKHTLDIYLRNLLQDRSVNDELFEDCKVKSGIESLDETEAATVILRELWNRLRDTHKRKAIECGCYRRLIL
jgi:hypothetical protein